MTFAITGATGQLGRIVVSKLKAQVSPAQIVALARDPAKGSDLGVEVREADYEKPDTLDKALAGVDALLLISSSGIGKRAVQHDNVITAAKKAGVKKVVYTSLLHADSSPLSLAPEHAGTEAVLKNSSLAYTILRNSWYTENYGSRILGAVQTGVLAGSAGDGKISAATRADYAEAAVAVLTGSGHDGKLYELAGDEAFTLFSLASEISKQTGKEVLYKDLSPADYAAALEGGGLPKALAEVVASFDVGAAQGALFDDSHQLSKLLGHPTTPLADAVAAALKS